MTHWMAHPSNDCLRKSKTEYTQYSDIGEASSNECCADKGYQQNFNLPSWFEKMMNFLENLHILLWLDSWVSFGYNRERFQDFFSLIWVKRFKVFGEIFSFSFHVVNKWSTTRMLISIGSSIVLGSIIHKGYSVCIWYHLINKT